MLQHRHHPAFSAGCGRSAGCGPDVAWPDEARTAVAGRPRPAEIEGRCSGRDIAFERWERRCSLTRTSPIPRCTNKGVGVSQWYPKAVNGAP